MEKYNLGPGWDEWKIEELIGRGTLSMVYKVRRFHNGKSEYEAVKIIDLPERPSRLAELANDGLSDDEIKNYYLDILERTKKETAVLTALTDNKCLMLPDDVKIVEKQDSFGWTIYIRMKLCEPLSIYSTTHEMDVKHIIQMGIDICHALEICSEVGILLGSIKPDNIYYYEDSYKLGDLSIIRHLRSTNDEIDKHATRYVAPEIYRGEEYDVRADIYSLGIILYKLLNFNRIPFVATGVNIAPGANAAAISKRLRGDDIPLLPHLPTALSECILKACAYKRENRYSTPTEFKDALLSQLKLPTTSLSVYHTTPSTIAQPKNSTVNATAMKSGLASGSKTPDSNLSDGFSMSASPLKSQADIQPTLETEPFTGYVLVPEEKNKRKISEATILTENPRFAMISAILFIICALMGGIGIFINAEFGSSLFEAIAYTVVSLSFVIFIFLRKRRICLISAVIIAVGCVAECVLTRSVDNVTSMLLISMFVFLAHLRNLFQSFFVRLSCILFCSAEILLFFLILFDAVSTSQFNLNLYVYASIILYWIALLVLIVSDRFMLRFYGYYKNEFIVKITSVPIAILILAAAVFAYKYAILMIQLVMSFVNAI